MTLFFVAHVFAFILKKLIPIYEEFTQGRRRRYGHGRTTFLADNDF